jgi:hypothetical protein
MNKREIKRRAYRHAFEAVQGFLDAGQIWEDVDEDDPEKQSLLVGMDQIAQMLFERSDLAGQPAAVDLASRRHRP